MAASPLEDIELARLRDGYPALASWIACDPDSETFVFRKFNRLAARNLLHLQSQLIALEREIDDQDEQARSDMKTIGSSMQWEMLVDKGRDHTSLEKRRLETFSELQEKIKEYQEAILLQAQMVVLQAPSNRVLSTFRDYMDGAALKISGFDKIPLISGRAAEFLSEKNDLGALKKEIETDILSRLLQDHWAFQKRKASDPFDRTTMYRANHVVRTVAIISMMIAAVLLIGATITLHIVKNARARLGLIAGYTFLFALSMMLLTNARKAEIYGATAAYAAVLVVFVSGDLEGSKKQQCLLQLANGVLKTIECPT